MAGLYLSSPARAYLENVRPSRARKGVARRLSRAELERRLDRDIRAKGEAYAKDLRDNIKRLAPMLGLEAAEAELDTLIGALLGTQKASLTTDVGLARASGHPFDPLRVELLQTLHAELSRTAASQRLEPDRPDEDSNLAFFEAYFSNFIEGTEFELSEAKAIVFEARIPTHRPADAHDILGTFRVVADRREMRRTPQSFAELLELLKHRHREIMGGRPDKSPGEFKTETNRAGSTVFVAPELVGGTLERGFELYRTLADPFFRAVFMMFLVSEVHPFVDGNGRVARIMMNAELVAAHERRIIIPTVYRNNYLAALKAHSHSRRPEPLVRVLDFAQRYTLAIDFTSYDRAEHQLRRTYAFMDPNEADREGVRLRLPD